MIRPITAATVAVLAGCILTGLLVVFLVRETGLVAWLVDFTWRWQVR